MRYKREWILSAMQFEVADAYWISPGGKIRPVATTHIDDVINHPAAFGLTDAVVKETYKKFNEKLRIEGKARDEIMRDLILKEWIRIRYVASRDYYYIDAGSLIKRAREYLFEWAAKIIELQPDHRFSDVVISVFTTGDSLRYSLEDLVGEALFSKKEQQEPVSNYLIPLRMKDDFLDMGPVGRMERSLMELAISSQE